MATGRFGTRPHAPDEAARQLLPGAALITPENLRSDSNPDAIKPFANASDAS